MGNSSPLHKSSEYTTCGSETKRHSVTATRSLIDRRELAQSFKANRGHRGGAGAQDLQLAGEQVGNGCRAALEKDELPGGGARQL
jgi:hypothetical protein